MGQPFLQWCLALGQPIDIVGEAGLATVDLEEGARKKNLISGGQRSPETHLAHSSLRPHPKEIMGCVRWGEGDWDIKHTSEYIQNLVP